MLKERVAAAAVFGPALVAVVAWGGWPLTALVSALVALALGEFCLLVGMTPRAPLAWVTFALGAGAAAHTLGKIPTCLDAAVLPGLVMLPAAAALWAGPPWAARLAQVGPSVWGALWCGALLPFLVRLRGLEGAGKAAALTVLLSVWAADTGAYFAGRRFGRRPLARHASPGKTLEGAWGGLVAAVATSAGLAQWVFPGVLSLQEAASVGVICAVMGPVGDIAESIVKRSVGAKDSSRLIPGHGGVLDRFDALMFAAPVAYAYLRWAGR